jgi:hypothetical protein
VKKLNYILLFAFLAIAFFQTCKSRENLTGKNEKQTNNKQLVSSDTIPAYYARNGNNQDTIEKVTIQMKSLIDTINTEKISTINPKIHPDVLPFDSKDTVKVKENEVPNYKITKLSNFNPFLETMYPGVEWKRYDNDNPNNRYHVYAAFYKGTQFLHEYVNSFVYYFFDIGEISHEDLIKTVTYWILQPLYPEIEITSTKLYDQKDEDKFNHFDYYLSTGVINGEKLEVYTIIRNDQVYKFRALKNKVEIRGLGFFI